MRSLDIFSRSGQYLFRLDGSPVPPPAKPPRIRPHAEQTRWECYGPGRCVGYVWAIGPADARHKAAKAFGEPILSVAYGVSQRYRMGDVL